MLFKDRLLYLLQPPLEDLFAGKQVQLPFQPYPYQLKGIAFLMPRHAALLADEMGLGKTVQVIVALRLLFHAGLIRRALVVCPKPLVINWSRELRTWAEDLPFEVIGGDTADAPGHLARLQLPAQARQLRAADPRRRRASPTSSVHFDVVVLDEAQRIKNRDSKTAQVVARHPARPQLGHDRHADREPHRRPGQHLRLRRSRTAFRRTRRPRCCRQLTRDCILRRTKEEVATDMPPKIIQRRLPGTDAGPARGLRPGREGRRGPPQRAGRHDHGAARLRAGDAAQADLQLRPAHRARAPSWSNCMADMAEVAESGRKAIVFSQWVEPLETLAKALAPFGPLLYHGKVPHQERQPILDRFKTRPDASTSS